ncbi:hypothetical protein M0638_27920, partial [Roseomonas sp. NAR14]
MDTAMPSPGRDETPMGQVINLPRAEEIARLAALTPVEYDRERQAAASRLGCRVGTLDMQVRAARQAQAEAEAEAPDAAPEEEPAAGPAPDRAATALELARLAKLSPTEFAQERRAAASRLGLTVKDLAKAVHALRRQAFQEREAAERER